MVTTNDQSKMTKEEYEKMDPITHIHRRPDMYVGSVHVQTQPNDWIWNMTTNQFEWKESPKYSEGLLRIYMEPLSNVMDHIWRSREQGYTCKKVVVTLCPKTGECSVWNDGKPIPLEKSLSTHLYTPELIFGHLLTSSNYNDQEERFSSGRNGVGVKLTNVFSHRFTVECGNAEQGQWYEQVWTDHMRNVTPPKRKTKKTVSSFTKVSFLPDLSFFGIDPSQGLGDTIVGFIMKAGIDMAMSTGVPLYWNDKKYHIKTLKEYCSFFPSFSSTSCIDVKCSLTHPKESLQVLLFPSSDKMYHEASFVNGLYTREGGVHVQAVLQPLLSMITQKLNKQWKETTSTPFSIKDVKPHLFLVVQAQLINPSFTSQSKTKVASPTPSVTLDPKCIQPLFTTKWTFLDAMKSLLSSRQVLTLKKTEKKSRKAFHRIEGLDHANKAFSKHSSECTLILCEGLSAKTYAVTGMHVGCFGKKGRDYFGAFALKGKVLNCRNASRDTIAQNKEIVHIIQALNLKHGVDYTQDSNFQTLGYGKVLIITDADVDGLHIASLLVNMFHVLFPSLLQRPFLFWMMTPIAKVFLKSTTLTFYNDVEYQQYLQESNSNHIKKVKYYKGLGTSSDQEVKETFGQKIVQWVKDEKTDETLHMVFSKTTASQRREWMEHFSPSHYQIPQDQYSITLFLNQDHIRFSMDDCRRNIPNLYDGCKLSQRKILYAVLKKPLSSEGKSMKVAQLAGYVAEVSNYHHGEQCLYDTITRMAQDFPGGNNLPLLEKDGQFGTRMHLGKDAANGRYLFTKMMPYTRILFPSVDDPLLSYTLDDGEKVEPDAYIPILPMIFLNGCKTGIGSGWSSQLPMYSPKEILKRVLFYLDDDRIDFDTMTPFYRGFQGSITPLSLHKFQSQGILREYQESSSSSSLSSKKKVIANAKKKESHEILEIPLDISIDKYKEFLETLVEQKQILSFQNYSTPQQPHFCFTPSPSFEPTLHNLKLTSEISLSNMVLLTENHQIQKYSSLNDIFLQYAQKRLSLYETRRQQCLQECQAQMYQQEFLLAFLHDVVEERLCLWKREESDVIQDMETRYVSHWTHVDMSSSIRKALSIPLRQCTQDQVEKVRRCLLDLQKKRKELEQQTPKLLWKKDLEHLSSQWSKFM